MIDIEIFFNYIEPVSRHVSAKVVSRQTSITIFTPVVRYVSPGPDSHSHMNSHVTNYTTNGCSLALSGMSNRTGVSISSCRVNRLFGFLPRVGFCFVFLPDFFLPARVNFFPCLRSTVGTPSLSSPDQLPSTVNVCFLDLPAFLGYLFFSFGCLSFCFAAFLFLFLGGEKVEPSLLQSNFSDSDSSIELCCGLNLGVVWWSPPLLYQS